MANTIYHLATRSDFLHFLEAGSYRPPSLKSEGFIHGAGSKEVTLEVAQSYFKGADLPIWVLVIHLDPSMDVRWESPAPIGIGKQSHHKDGRLFPHIYGPIPRAAIVAVGVLSQCDDTFTWPTAMRPLGEALNRHEDPTMTYLHTMLRVANLDRALAFYVGGLGLQEVRRKESTGGRFTLVFLKAPGDADTASLLELTWNWDQETLNKSRFFGHLAFGVQDIYKTCQHLMDEGVVINRPPRDGRMAFVQSPDGHSIELLQAGESLPPQAPWATMENSGSW